MCEPAAVEWIQPERRLNATRVGEFGRVFVTDATRHCPAPELCDIGPGETYEDYIRRHAVDHEIFYAATFEDIERNLFVWCSYACHKFCLDNDALTPWPGWEDHEFLSNWDFNDEDLEKDLPKKERMYRLPSLPNRRPGVARRQKKLEKPRETMKTAEGFAMTTFEHLHEYNVLGNVNFRITVHSSTTKLTRKRYINQASKVWGRRSGKLFELFWGEEEYGPEGRKRKRRISLLHTRGAVDKQNNLIMLRWLQDAEKAFATHSMMGIGADSESTGERCDYYFGDDVCTADNSNTFDKRQNVKTKVAEQEKQLEHGGRWLWIDTRKHLNDVSGEIDVAPQSDYFHILHRKATWICPKCDQVMYYWPVDGTGKPRITEEWLNEQRRKHTERDFWNELMNEPQDPDKQTFKREWFKKVALNNAVPLEVRAGLGLIHDEEDRLRFEEQLEQLTQSGIRVQAFNVGDPAGREKASKRGDSTAICGLRFAADSGIWITDLRSGQWGAQQQKEEAYASALLNKPKLFIWEIVQDSGVEKAWNDFSKEKSAEVGHPVMLPMDFRKPKRIVSKQERIEQLEPYFRRGVNILESAGEPSEIEKFISQFCEYLISDHDDYPDAVANVLDFLKTMPVAKNKQPVKDNDIFSINEAGNDEVSLFPIFKKMLQPKPNSWGRSGGVR
jgi:hypothetical protein